MRPLADPPAERRTGVCAYDAHDVCPGIVDTGDPLRGVPWRDSSGRVRYVIRCECDCHGGVGPLALDEIELVR